MSEETGAKLRRRVESLFHEALAKSEDQRERFLAESCQDDEAVYREVKSLLSHYQQSTPLDQPLVPQLPAAAFNQGDRVGPYEIIRQLGKGGMGEVYLARDSRLGRKVALKILPKIFADNPEWIERLRREARTASALNHPNILTIYEFGQHGDIQYMASEFVEGTELRELIGRLSTAETLDYARQMARALAAAHSVGVVHRDIKPENIMVRSDGFIKVLDFGLAKLTNPPLENGESLYERISSSSVLSVPGLLVGTINYMSPEQVRGQPVDHRTDIWSWGVVLYEMLAGKRPFESGSPSDTLACILTKNPDPPCKDQQINRSVLRALEKKPEERYQSILEALRDLTIVPRQKRWLKWSAIAAALLLLVMGVALRFFLFQRTLPSQKHVAVLPFQAAGTDPALRAQAYELTESLAQHLAQLQPSNSSLWVVPWSEVKNSLQGDLKDAQRRLGANLLVVGDFRKSDTALLLHMQLKDARTLQDLRSEEIEIPETRTFSLEDTLLERVSSMLQLKTSAIHLDIDQTSAPGAYEFYEQGRGYLLRGDTENVDHAIALFQRAIEKDPKFALAYADLGWAYETKYRATKDPQSHDQAERNLRTALSLNDRLGSAHLTLGMIREDIGDPGGAVLELRKALELDPTNEQTRSQLARVYDKNGNWLDAEALLQEGLKRNPASWFGYNALGYFYYNHAKYDRAEAMFKTASELAPDNPWALFNLGGIYLLQGKNQEAEAVLTRALAVKPTAGTASNLGTLYFYQKRYSAAAAMYQKATELVPWDDRYWRNLGDACQLGGNKTAAAEAYAKAIQAVQKLLATRPGDGQLLSNLALYWAKVGQKNNARLALSQAAAQVPGSDPIFLFTSALVYELIGMRDRALHALRSAIRAGYSLSEVQNVPELSELRLDKRYSETVGLQSQQGSAQ